MTDTKSKTDNPQSISSNSNTSPMAELLSSHKSLIVSLRKRDNIKGIITKLTPSEILVDIGAKSEAVVLEKDKQILRNLLSLLTVGSEVTVSVLDPESEMGYPVVSLRRFLDNLRWEKLEKLHKAQKQIIVTVDGITRGGFLVTTEEGIAGFLPNSQSTFSGNSQDVVGTKKEVFIVELNRPVRKVVFSQKKQQSQEEFQDTIKDFKRDQKIEVVVSHITPFGIFVSLNAPAHINGLIHISEISWDKVLNIEEMFTVGQKIEAVIIGFDTEAKRVDLSLKRLTADPFSEIAKQFVVDQKVKGKVSKILSSGVLLDIEETSFSSPVEGFIRKEKIPPTVSYEAGQYIDATVSEIDKKRHRIVLIPILKEKPIGYR